MHTHTHTYTHTHTHTHTCEPFQVFPIVGYTNFSITMTSLMCSVKTRVLGWLTSHRVRDQNAFCNSSNGAYFGTNLIECSEDHYCNVPVLRYTAPEFTILLLHTTHNALKTQ